MGKKISTDDYQSESSILCENAGPWISRKKVSMEPPQ